MEERSVTRGERRGAWQRERERDRGRERERIPKQEHHERWIHPVSAGGFRWIRVDSGGFAAVLT